MPIIPAMAFRLILPKMCIEHFHSEPSEQRGRTTVSEVHKGAGSSIPYGMEGHAAPRGDSVTHPSATGPKLGGSYPVQALFAILSIIAGCTDIISFLAFSGLFTAQITGNWVLLAAHIVAGSQVQISKLLSVPMFIVTVVLTTLMAGRLKAIGFAPLYPLLLLQFLLLVGFLALSVAIGPRIDPNTTAAVIAGMVGVSAMAVQNALIQVAFKGMPATAVMTSNVTRFAVDIGTVLLRGNETDVRKALNRATATLPVIAGFAVGCGLGAACEVAFGLWSLALPAGLALLAFALGFAVDTDTEKRV